MFECFAASNTAMNWYVKLLFLWVAVTSLGQAEHTPSGSWRNDPRVYTCQKQDVIDRYPTATIKLYPNATIRNGTKAAIYNCSTASGEMTIGIAICSVGSWSILFCTDPYHTTKCPPPWELAPSGYCVRRFLPMKSWDDAQSQCRDYGGRLAEIRSKEDDLYLGKWSSNSNGDDSGTFHMDLHRIRDPAVPYPIYYYYFNGDNLIYTNWDQNEPNKEYNCGLVYHFGKWRIGNCNDKRPFVCERLFSGYGACGNGNQSTFSRPCKAGYENGNGRLVCKNGEWQLEGCKAIPNYCPNSLNFDAKDFPGWTGEANIQSSSVSAEASYDCLNGYTNGGHKLVCQNNGRWSEPNCYKINDYCKLPTTGLELFNVTHNEMALGDVQFYCKENAWPGSSLLTTVANFKCFIGSKTEGKFWYENGVCRIICPDNWEVLPSGRCAQHFSLLKSWSDAKSACAEQGGNLVFLRSKADNDYLQKYVTHAVHDIGGAFYMDRLNPLIYSNWAPGQPNRDSSCLLNFGLWRVENCAEKRPYVCERIAFACLKKDLLRFVAAATFPAKIEANSQATVTDCGPGYEEGGGSATCVRDRIWHMKGCKELPVHCTGNPTGSFPGWDGTHSISDRSIFAKAEYGCSRGYTRGNNRLVCQKNGQWSAPNCYKINNYCKFSSQVIDEYNTDVTELPLGGFINAVCKNGETGQIVCVNDSSSPGKLVPDPCQRCQKQSLLQRYSQGNIVFPPSLAVGARAILFDCSKERNVVAHGYALCVADSQWRVYGCTDEGLECPPPWQRMPSGKCIRRYLPMATWSDANRTCFDHDAKLVEITSKADDDYLGKMTTHNADGTFYMGVKDFSGRQLYAYSQRYLIYKNWDRYQPNSDYHCGLKGDFGRWSMGSCKELRPFVCERVCPPPWKEMPSGKCVQHFAEAKTWSDAKTFCENWLGMLVEVQSKLDDDYLNGWTHNNNFFMGIHVKNGVSVYASTSSSYLIYVDWDPVLKPNGTGDNPGCAYKSQTTKWRIKSCNDKSPFVCERRFDEYIVEGGCFREDLLEMVSRAVFPPTTDIYSGLQVFVDSCGPGYMNENGVARCTNGVWKLDGCQEIPTYCPSSIKYEEGKYPGYNGAYFIGERYLFAEATYDCTTGYTRGNHTMVCQRNGEWSNPNCLKFPGYCQFSLNGLGQSDIHTTQLSVGYANIPCQPWSTGYARFWCDIYNKTNGRFSYQPNKCQSEKKDFCSSLPNTYTAGHGRWVFHRDGNDNNRGTTAQVYFDKDVPLLKAHIICRPIKVKGYYLGRFVLDPDYSQSQSESVLMKAISRMYIKSRRKKFCQSIWLPLSCREFPSTLSALNNYYSNN